MLWIHHNDGTLFYTAGVRYEVEEKGKTVIIKTFDEEDKLLLELPYKVGEVESVEIDIEEHGNPLKKPGLGKNSQAHLMQMFNADDEAEKSKKIVKRKGRGRR